MGSAVEYAKCAGAKVPEALAAPAPSDTILDVHIIAHTHDDTGYLETVDEYYNDKAPLPWQRLSGIPSCIPCMHVRDVTDQHTHTHAPNLTGGCTSSGQSLP